MEDILASIRNILAEDEESNPERAKDTPVMQDIAEMPVNTEAQKKQNRRVLILNRNKCRE